MSKIILAGGGNADQSNLVDEYFSNLKPNMNMLFIPQAIAPKQSTFEEAFDWIHKPEAFKDISITMWKRLHDKTIEDIREFDAIYIGGGNTYELLHQLRESGFLSLISEAIKMDKIIYGISAGAYVLGKDISERLPSDDKNKNAIGLDDLSALDLLNGYKVHCHYSSDHDKHLFDFEKQHHTPLIAVPETSGVVVEDTSCQVLGREPVSIFSPDGKKTVYRPNSSFYIEK